MAIYRESLLRRAIRRLALHAIAWVEETNNWDLRRNGELLVLQEALKYCKVTYPDSSLIVVDAGASEGEYVGLVASEADKLQASVWIHAFEPQAESFSRLLSLHGAKKQVVLNPIALSDRDGTGEIFSDRNGSPLASLYKRDLSSIDIQLNQREAVRLVRLASYIQDANLQHLHFLKIDVEGSEFSVLEGAEEYLKPDFIDFIQFEYGGTNLDARIPLKELFSFLEGKGFIVAKIMRRGLRVKKYSPWMDNYLYANYVALSPGYYQRLVDRD